MCYLVSVVLKDCTDVTDGLEPEIREIFSSALLISEKCSDVSGFLFKSFFASKFASFEPQSKKS